MYHGNLLLYNTAHVHVSTDASMVILTSSDHYFKLVPIMLQRTTMLTSVREEHIP